ncbi:MAG TPA: hypothetical protein VHV78_17925 [Gemmatimonadaceae bacterium]|jgi:hypothetical protein|nr:hypothetical protein [Gemmatimonadaceae bacterium]
MSHLPSERLAALVDEPPTAAELAHLAACAECVRERAIYRSLADLASAETARIGTPITTWESIVPALAADGIIDADPGNGRRFVHSARRRSRTTWTRAAAAIVLAASGAVIGRLSAGASILPANLSAARGRSSASASDTARFASVDDARAVQAQSYSRYQTATAYLAERDTARLVPDSPGAMRTRLAALDRANAVMGEALVEAPYDPVINGYYLTTQSQREATIRQLNTVMPASMRIHSY